MIYVIDPIGIASLKYTGRLYIVENEHPLSDNIILNFRRLE